MVYTIYQEIRDRNYIVSRIFLNQMITDIQYLASGKVAGKYRGRSGKTSDNVHKDGNCFYSNASIIYHLSVFTEIFRRGYYARGSKRLKGISWRLEKR